MNVLNPLFKSETRKKFKALTAMFVVLFIVGSLIAANKGWKKNSDVTKDAKKRNCIILRGGTKKSLKRQEKITGLSVQCNNTLSQINAKNIKKLYATLDGNPKVVGVAQWQSVGARHYNAKLWYKPEPYVKKSGTNNYHCEVKKINGEKLAGCLQYWTITGGTWQKMR